MPHTHNLPDLGDLAQVVYQYGQDLGYDYDPEADEEAGDIRLQIVDGLWSVHTGDSQYDQDHRGHWGYAFVPRDCSQEYSDEIAADLIEQAQDAIAEAHS